VDVGFSGRFELYKEKEGKEEGAKPEMYLQFGAIINGGDAQSITGSSDKVLPYIRCGLNLHIKSIKR
jgi:hypothetical protein